MLEIPFAVIVLLSLGSGLVASRVLATRSGRPLKALAIREAVLLAGWGFCCLMPKAAFLGGPLSWGSALLIWAIGGGFLVAFGGFAYLVGSFLIGLFCKVPEDKDVTGQDTPPQATGL
jgi:hypothetical protein